MKKKINYRILLSAYNCNPIKGSDAGVAWQWAVNLAQYQNNVTVITREINKKIIVDWLCHNDSIANHLKFIYFDDNACLKVMEFLFRGVSHYFYYYYWQIRIREIVKKAHLANSFDIIQHVCWVNIRLPSFLGGIGPRFVLGPVAGGEYAPFALWKGYGYKQWVSDSIRLLWNLITKYDPILRSSLKSADTIFVTSKETHQLIPAKYYSKAFIKLAVGVEDCQIISPPKKRYPDFNTNNIKILYVGRFLDWKAVGHIGLPAFKKFLETYPNSTFTLVGNGRDKQRWEKRISKLNLDNNVTIIEWLERDKLNPLYDKHDILLFPSLHDSGGMVILEALARGLPVVCLDLGGPGVIVNPSCGIAIKTTNKSTIGITSEVAKGMRKLIKNPNTYKKMSTSATKRAKQFRWENLVWSTYEEIGFQFNTCKEKEDIIINSTS